MGRSVEVSLEGISIVGRRRFGRRCSSAMVWHGEIRGLDDDGGGGDGKLAIIIGICFIFNKCLAFFTIIFMYC